MNCKRSASGRPRKNSGKVVSQAKIVRTRGRKKKMRATNAVKPATLMRRRKASPQEAGTPVPFPADFAPLSLPLVRLADNAEVLPRYSNVLQRGDEEGVEVNDLNILQAELEKLATVCLVRHRTLISQLKILSCDSSDGVGGASGNGDDPQQPTVKKKRGRPFGSHHRHHLQVKRKRQVFPGGAYTNNNVILKRRRKRPVMATPEVEAAVAVAVTESAPDINLVPVKHKVPIGVHPNNSASDFWSFVKPYCADVTEDDVNFLDALIRECSEEVDLEIPPLAESYAMKWSSEMLSQYTNYKTVGRHRTKNPPNYHAAAKLKTADMNALLEKFSTPISERLLSTILEEKVVTLSAGPGADFLKGGDQRSAKPGDCLAERLKAELIEQGILEEEAAKNGDDDDILGEIRRCQRELRHVNCENLTRLKELREAIAEDRRRQAVKDALDDVDKRILEIYDDILLARQQQRSAAAAATITSTPNVVAAAAAAAAPTSGRQFLKKHEKEVAEIVRKQIRLHKEIVKLSDPEPPGVTLSISSSPSSSSSSLH